MKTPALDRLGRKVPPIKKKVGSVVEGITKRVKRKNSAVTTPSTLERTPARDIVVRSNTEKKAVDTTNSIGNIVVERNRQLAKIYVRDLESVGQEIPEASFVHRFNTGSTKELPSILDKITNRSELYEELGYSGIVRDGVRGMLFMPEADKNYPKIIKAMEKRGYKIAKAPMLDAEGKVVYDANGVVKQIDDIDVRTVPSGYSDVQMRFEKGNKLYELLILPGANYAEFYKKEHALVFERFRKYDSLGVTKDSGAKQIVKAIKEEFHTLTRRLYNDALQRDLYGTLAVRGQEPITFTEENITNLKSLFASLKNLYRGKFETLPPSKRNGVEVFEQSKRYMTLDVLEGKLKEVMELYKPERN